MYTELEQHLLSLINHSMIAYIVLWAAYIIKFKRIDSYSITLTVFVLFSSLMTVLTPYIFSYSKGGEGIFYKAIWHGFFVAAHIIEIISITKLHESFRLKISALSLVFVALLGVQASLHLVRLVEKSLFDSTYTAFIYTEGIKFVNLVFVFVCVLCIILGVIRNYQLDKKCV
ncbi:hypothetical protein N473_18515 [Pseudoalteromonas luteoviolacea CPMOR-1]|uniref:Uncharacterized protein n=1 Tax=Pseudoalteromonas luteoviolacea CPMOR-1 TaxID=1365248 RepID=A0A167KD95_9GAMM|nr:hypothetical protein [Pseudoalteromonas luteoviolacea]KZN62624.1 hypothetical protein N473_18515 [Pseudoalteromonas luteoviolacea CPMOR-1]